MSTVDMLVYLIKKGKLTIEQVAPKFKTEVEKKLK